MKLIISLTLCVLTLRVESQSFLNQEYYNTDQSGTYAGRKGLNTGPTDNYQFGPNSQSKEAQRNTTFDSYLQAISKSQNTQNQQFPSSGISDGRLQFKEPSLDLTPPTFGPNSSQNYYVTQQHNSGRPEDPVSPNNPLPQESSDNKKPNQIDNLIFNNVTVALTNFGIHLLKTTINRQQGNVIISPTSIATVLALLQQGATGESRDQITRALQMTPEATESAYGTITANMRKRNSRNILTIANNILIADAFELNNAFKTLAVRTFWSEITPTSFKNPSQAIDRVNSWVASKTNSKINNLLPQGSLSQNTQLVLVNAVYFKGIWETKFKPEWTELGEFHLSNGEKKMVPFMYTRHSFQVGYDRATHALVTILPFESHQYSVMLILPSAKDNVANLLEYLTVDQLMYYHTFSNTEIKLEIPKFTLKSDTDLALVLKDLGITNIFGSKSELSGIGTHRTFSPQMSNAVHAGYLSIDEQGVTAAAASSIAAVALSYDDSTTTFRADRPFVAVLWDKQFSIPLFIAKIEDPS